MVHLCEPDLSRFFLLFDPEEHVIKPSLKVVVAVSLIIDHPLVNLSALVLIHHLKSFEVSLDLKLQVSIVMVLDCVELTRLFKELQRLFHKEEGHNEVDED